MRKYRLTRDLSLDRVPTLDLREPPAATREQLLLAHDAAYIDAVFEGTLAPAAQREIGFPWSPAMVERACRSVGATLAASQAASLEGVAVNLAGGTHHADAAKGGGFCVFNDVAVAVGVLHRADDSAGRPHRRVAVIDLDVHQGNGTAAILGCDPAVFTLSLHGEHNFPFRKVAGTLDVGLPDGCDDAPYLAALDDALHRVAEFEPMFLFFLAGADPYIGDRLGRLGLSVDGLAARDRRVFAFAAELAVPIVVAMAGGYGRVIEETCAIHAQTVALADAHWRAHAGRRVPSAAAQAVAR